MQKLMIYNKILLTDLRLCVKLGTNVRPLLMSSPNPGGCGGYTERSVVMKRIGLRFRIISLLVLGALSLSSCTYTLQEAPQAPASSQESEEETEEEPAAHEILRDQLIATLNLSRQLTNRIVASDSLDESAAFLADVVLDDASLYAVSDGSRILEDTLGNFAYAYLYDGTLTSAQVGRLALETLQGKAQSSEQKLDADQAEKSKTVNRAIQNRSLGQLLDERDQQIASLSVVWGENTNYSIWLLLVQAEELV